jgi:multicomponent Na+:H+ antiporter subunit C
MTALIPAIVVGTMFAVGTFLVLRRDLVRVIWGLAVISQGANVYLVTMGGIAAGVGGAVPVLSGHGEAAAAGAATADPLVQALVLTAIVISFATTAFALVLIYRVYEENDTIDTSQLEAGW